MANDPAPAPDWAHITQIRLIVSSSSPYAANDYAIDSINAVAGGGCGLPICL